MKKMKALLKARPERGIWMKEVPVPEPGLNDVIKDQEISNMRY